MRTTIGLLAMMAMACGGGSKAMTSASGDADGTASTTNGDGDGDGDGEGEGEGDGDGDGDGDGETEGTKFDLGALGDLGTPCTEDDPECDDVCDPEFEPEDFVDPIIKCNWTKSPVIMTPLVADLEGDGTTEIIFVDFMNGSLVIIRGSDCTEITKGPAGDFGTRSQLAIADLDEDGDLEILGMQATANYGNHKIRAVDHTGNTIAVSEAAQVSGGTFGDGGPAIANLDGKGVPEIAYAGMAVRLEGNQFTTLFNNPIQSGHWGILTAVADVDLDGVPELVTGNRIFDGATGADETPNSIAAVQAGYTAIGDFDPDTPEPEIVLISSQTGSPSTIRIFHPTTGALVLGPINFGQQWGGAPTIGDFDGDEVPEVAVAGYKDYVVFDLECDGNNLPQYCAEPGIRWRQPSQDFSSGSTGSTLFDFNGDGWVEVVYRDEQKLRIYEGPTGAVLSEFAITSGTILENPVVADVDADDHAEVVVPSHGQTQGIYVLEDPDDLWVAARALWNQHTYHITNINEDGTVPLDEKNNWDKWNNFRQNVGPNPDGATPCKPVPAG